MAWKLTAALVLAAALAVPGVVWGADRPAGPEPTFGFVDLQQVRQAMLQSPNWKVMTRKVEDARTRAENEMAALQVNRNLTPAERAEREMLRLKQKLTEPEKIRLVELDTKSEALDREFSALAQTEKPAAEQVARIKELDALRKEGVAYLEREMERISAALEKLEKELIEEMGRKVETAVAQVARQKKLNVVVERQLLLFGGVDLTADVVKQLK